MLSERHANALRILAARLSGTSVTWAVTGSTGFALHGLPIEPHDMGIQTDEAGAYQIEQLFPDEVIRPVNFSSAGHIRSHFGRLRIGGVEVEIMGALQKRQANGEWEPPVEVERYTEIVDLDGLSIPVLSLAYECEAYERLGRTDRSREIRRWLERTGA